MIWSPHGLAPDLAWNVAEQLCSPLVVVVLTLVVVVLTLIVAQVATLVVVVLILDPVRVAVLVPVRDPVVVGIGIVGARAEVVLVLVCDTVVK